MNTKNNIEVINAESFATSIRLTADFKINGVNFRAEGEYIFGDDYLDFVEVYREEDYKQFESDSEEFEIGESILGLINIKETLTF